MPQGAKTILGYWFACMIIYSGTLLFVAAVVAIMI